jgi:hypothetical protein
MESREAVKLRLQSEGRWKEALAFREGLKSEGVNPREAYRRMVEAFPAGTDPNIPSQNGAPAMPANNPSPPPKRRIKKRQKVNLRADLLWVYENLTQPDDRGAPSEGARSMWAWAKRNPDAFYRTLAAKVLKEVPVETPVDKGAEVCLQLCEDWIKRWRETNRHKCPKCGYEEDIFDSDGEWTVGKAPT